MTCRRSRCGTSCPVLGGHLIESVSRYRTQCKAPSNNWASGLGLPVYQPFGWIQGHYDAFLHQLIPDEKCSGLVRYINKLLLQPRNKVLSSKRVFNATEAAPSRLQSKRPWTVHDHSGEFPRRHVLKEQVLGVRIRHWRFKGR